MSAPAVEAALEAARAYCALVDRRHELELDAFLASLHEATARLYAGTMALTELEPSATEYPRHWSHEQWVVLYGELKAKFGQLDRYRELFDPYEDESEEPVDGSLADAIADVYGEAVRAVTIADGGALDDAAWELRFLCEVHWGHHAVDAMRAIHAHRFMATPRPDSPPPS